MDEIRLHKMVVQFWNRDELRRELDGMSKLRHHATITWVPSRFVWISSPSQWPVQSSSALMSSSGAGGSKRNATPVRRNVETPTASPKQQGLNARLFAVKFRCKTLPER